MLNLHNRCFKACLALSITFSSVAMAEPLAGFQFEAPLADGKASLRRAVLPSDVMLNLQQRNYADLVVVNAANQIVPSSVQMIDTQQETLTDLRLLAFFRSDDPQQLGTLLTLPQGATKPDITQLTQPGRQYLIVHDANFSPDSLPLTKLRLDWGNLEQWLPKNLVLEVSDDLIQWRPVAIKALPYVLKQQGNVLKTVI